MISIILISNNNYNSLNKLLIKSIINNSDYKSNFILCTDDIQQKFNYDNKIIQKTIIPFTNSKTSINVEKFDNIFNCENFIEHDMLYLDADCYCIKNFSSGIKYIQDNFNIHMALTDKIGRRRWWAKRSTIDLIAKMHHIELPLYKLNGGLFYIKKEYIQVFKKLFYYYKSIILHLSISLNIIVTDELIAMFAFYDMLQKLNISYSIEQHSHHLNQTLANFWLTQPYKTKTYYKESDFYDIKDIRIKNCNLKLNPSIIHYSGSTEKIMRYALYLEDR